MQNHETLSLGNHTVTFKNITFSEAIATARISPKLHEHKISSFLGAILGDKALPFSLTASQRHYTLMKYLQSQGNSFNFNTDFSKYEKKGEYLESVEVEGYKFRSLNGFECHALELYAKDYLDFFLGALALQVSGNGIPEILPSTDVNFAKNIIENRVPKVSSKDLEASESLINAYTQAEYQLNHLIELSFDDEGFVCQQLGGTDDAPYRFRPLSAVPESIRFLLEGISH